MVQTNPPEPPAVTPADVTADDLAAVFGGPVEGRDYVEMPGSTQATPSGPTAAEMHNAPFEGAGKTFELKSATPGLDGVLFRCEDYWDRVSGMSWMVSEGNPAAIKYGIRAGLTGLPVDDDVVYGEIGSFGELVHVSELGAAGGTQ